VARAEEPTDTGEMALLTGWLRYHRDALAAKCDGLDAGQLTTDTCPPSPLTLLGLVRHLTEMERGYGVYALGPGGPLHMVYGEYTDGGPEWDFDVDASMVPESFHNWEQERADTDRVLAGYRSPDEVASGNGRTVRWNLQKLVGEYARHNGHADLLRERIDGATGE
jgi:hypothetical protein